MAYFSVPMLVFIGEASAQGCREVVSEQCTQMQTHSTSQWPIARIRDTGEWVADLVEAEVDCGVMVLELGK